MTSTTMQAAAQYLRMSSDCQRYSLANQADIISAYAEENGFEIVQSYEDAGKSGVTAEKRSGLATLLSDVVSGSRAYSTILVLDVSRWGRYQDPDEAAHYEFLCRSAGVTIHYCGEAFSEGYAGSIMKQLKRVMAGEYSRELSEKVRKGKRRLAILGHAPGGPCPYGLQRSEFDAKGSLVRLVPRGERRSRPDHTLSLGPGSADEVAVVRRIFRSYVHGKRHPFAISEALNRDGILWSDGTPWNARRVSRTLQMELMAGRLMAGMTEHRLGGPRRRNPSNQWEIISQFEPIVPPSLFEAARRRRLELGGSAGRTERELLNDLKKVLRKHGRISASLIEKTLGRGRSCTYFNRFGSLRNAYARIGYDGPPLTRRPRFRSPCTPEVAIAALQQVQRDFGRVSVKLIEHHPDLPSARQLKKVFGSLTAAYAAANVKGGRTGRPQRRTNTTEGPVEVS